MIQVTAGRPMVWTRPERERTGPRESQAPGAAPEGASTDAAAANGLVLTASALTDAPIAPVSDRVHARWRDYDAFKAQNIEVDRSALLAAGAGVAGSSYSQVAGRYDQIKLLETNVDKDRAAMLAVVAPGTGGTGAADALSAYRQIKRLEPTIDFDRAAVLANAAVNANASGSEALALYDAIKLREPSIDKNRAGILASAALVGGFDAGAALQAYSAVKAGEPNIDNDRAAVLTAGLLLRGAGAEGTRDLLGIYSSVKSQPGENIDFHRAALLASTAYVADAPVTDVLEGYRMLKRGDIDMDRAAVLTAGTMAGDAGPELSTLTTGAWLQQELRRRAAEEAAKRVPDPYPLPDYGGTSPGDSGWADPGPWSGDDGGTSPGDSGGIALPRPLPRLPLPDFGPIPSTEPWTV